MSNKMIAQLQVASIIFIAVVVPMHWLAGKTHELSHCNGIERSMGRAVDLLYIAFEEVKFGGKKMLDEDFIISIFLPLYEDLPELEEYLTYFFEEKESNVVGSYSQSDRVLQSILLSARYFTPHERRINRCMPFA
jgi:hypothetical protein